jgi:hypothetical protein
VYNVPLIRVATTLVVAFHYRNTTASSVFIGALDTTAPTFLERSYAGFATTIDPAHLENIPPGQWGSQESFGTPGNFRIEARGQATDGIALTVEGRPELGVVRLNWTGTKPSYLLERASTPDFADAQTLATGTLTSYDDPVLADGATWYYRGADRGVVAQCRSRARSRGCGTGSGCALSASAPPSPSSRLLVPS